MKGARKGPLLAGPSTSQTSSSGASSLGLPLPKNGSAIPTYDALCLSCRMQSVLPIPSQRDTLSLKCRSRVRLSDANSHSSSSKEKSRTKRSRSGIARPDRRSCPSGSRGKRGRQRYHEGRQLRYAGKVRAGFTPHVRREVLGALKPLHTARCPFVDLPNTKTSRGARGSRPTKWTKCSGSNRNCWRRFDTPYV
jgi:hypothetical protein